MNIHYIPSLHLTRTFFPRRSFRTTSIIFVAVIMVNEMANYGLEVGVPLLLLVSIVVRER